VRVCECACERVLDSHTSQCKGFMYYAGRGSDFLIVSCFIRIDFRFESFVEFRVKCCSDCHGLWQNPLRERSEAFLHVLVESISVLHAIVNIFKFCEDGTCRTCVVALCLCLCVLTMFCSGF